MQAEDTELDALEFEHKTWGCTTRAEPAKHGKKVYRNKFVYAAKPALGTPGAEGYHAARFKARLVCTVWDEDIAGKDTYAPVIRHDTLRAFLSTCAADNHTLRCLDICNAFLLSELEEPMYMELPPGERFDARRKNGEVCVLRKGIYGLRTSPLRFFRHLNKQLSSCSPSAMASSSVLPTRACTVTRPKNSGLPCTLTTRS